MRGKWMMRKWLKELRVSHYVKNFLLFTPIFFEGSLFNGGRLSNLLAGFVCFCLGASAVYLINDIKDVEKDRQHPKKCTRPIAAGEISVRQAWIAVGTLLLLCVAVLWFGVEVSVRIPAIMVFCTYLINNLFYSVFGMKKVPLLDVALLVLGFYLRVLMGAVLVQIEISSWLYLVIITGACYLAFGKRRNELKAVGNDGRDVLAGYTEQFLDKAMYSCMTMANIFFALWCTQDEKEQKFMVLMPVFLLICFKYSMDIESNESDGDPMNVILHDKVLLGLGIIFVILLFALLY